jgi:hypothetical protein
MAIDSEKKFFLNNFMGAVAKKVGLGDLLDAATGDTAGLATNHIFVGSAGGAATDVAMSGDATIVASGALTIANSAVTKAKLAAGVKASHMVVYAAANVASVSGAANVVSVPGVLATDAVFIQLRAVGAAPATVLTALPAADQITVTFSADPSTDHAFDYQVIRATT